MIANPSIRLNSPNQVPKLDPIQSFEKACKRYQDEKIKQKGFNTLSDYLKQSPAYKEMMQLIQTHPKKVKETVLALITENDRAPAYYLLKTLAEQLKLNPDLILGCDSKNKKVLEAIKTLKTEIGRIK